MSLFNLGQPDLLAREKMEGNKIPENYESLEEWCEELSKINQSLKSENDRLREYVKHKHDCQLMYGGDALEPHPTCTCGLSELLEDK